MSLVDGTRCAKRLLHWTTLYPKSVGLILLSVSTTGTTRRQILPRWYWFQQRVSFIFADAANGSTGWICFRYYYPQHSPRKKVGRSAPRGAERTGGVQCARLPRGKKKRKRKKKKDKNYSLLFAVDEPINLKICTAIKRRSKLESCSGAERL